MNYRHAFHAGNHADVLKHVVLLALCDALSAKPAPCFALDTHAGRGLYALDAQGRAAHRRGRGRHRPKLAAPPGDAHIARYLAAIEACRAAHGPKAYPGSPVAARACPARTGPHRLLRTAARRSLDPASEFRDDPRVVVHQRTDGYAAMKALLPPTIGADALRARAGADRSAVRSAAGGIRRWRSPRCATACSAGRKACSCCGIRSSCGVRCRRSIRRAATMAAKSALRRRTAGAPRRLAAAHERQRHADAQRAVAIRHGSSAPTLNALRNALQEPTGGNAHMEWLRAPA